MRPNALEFAQSAALLPLRLLGLARNLLGQLRSASLIDLAVGLAEALPSGLYDGRGIQEYLEAVLCDPDRVNDFRLLENELYLTATDLDTCERIVLGGPDWDDVPISRGGGRLDRAADGLQAGGDQGPPPGRRRPALDHQRRRGGGGGRQVRDRGQPARALRERLPEGDPDDVGQPRAARARHGLPADRLPGLQAARPPAPARGGGALEGALPGRGHHPDRARPQRRADVRDEHPQLHPPGGDRAPRLRVGHAQAGLRLRRASRRSAPSTASRSRPRACARSCASSPRSARRPPAGGASSSRPPARCCGRPASGPKSGRAYESSATAPARRPAPPTAEGPRGRCAAETGPRRSPAKSARAPAAAAASSRRSAPRPRPRAVRTWSSAPSGRRRATITPWRRSAWASSAPLSRRGAQPDEVGLRGSTVDRQSRSGRRQPRALAAGTAPAALDLGVAGAQRVLDRRLGERVHAEHRGDGGQQRRVEPTA